MQPSKLTRLNLSTTSILVVGGASFEVDVLIQILSGFGAGALRRAETLEAAHLAVSREPVDFILVDHKVGEESGLEFIRHLRRLRTEVREAPVLIATAYAPGSIITAARDAGADFIVVKPLTPRVLYERMSWLAENRKGFVVSDDYVGPDRRVRAFGPPLGMPGRRAGDLSPELGVASQPNMSQDDIDALFSPAKAPKS